MLARAWLQKYEFIELDVIQAHLIDGEPYDIFLGWRTGTQGFEIYEISISFRFISTR